MNPYYHPEKLGLTTVGEVEWSEPDYSFDFTVVWKDAEGRPYWGDDAGCSCPAPFEDVNSVEDLTTGTFTEFVAHLNERSNDYSAPQIVDLLARMRLA